MSPNHVSPGERAEGGGPDLMRLYLDEIGRYELLTKDDEARLSQAIEEGRRAHNQLIDPNEPAIISSERRELIRIAKEGEAAKQAFINANLRLVVSVATRHQKGTDLALLDLVQEGNFGLEHAVDKFDWRKGFKFSTYATWWIRQAITRGIHNTGRTVRLPGHVHDTMDKIHGVRSDVTNKYGRDARDEEIAEQLNVPTESIAELLRLVQDSEPVLLDEYIGTENTTTLGDMIADPTSEEPFANFDTHEMYERVLERIDRDGVIKSERERRVFQLCHVEHQPQSEVAKQLDISTDLVRRLARLSMESVRAHFNKTDEDGQKPKFNEP